MGRYLHLSPQIIGDKPAYKVYLKADDYVNYNSSASGAPSISTSNSAVTVTKSGQTGYAIILLADKSGNGEVKYQATAEFNGGVATAKLPSGVKATNCSLTVLFADENTRRQLFREYNRQLHQHDTRRAWQY